AEQCWRACCCFSPEERLAWAVANQIEPPAYAQLPSAKGWHTIRLRDREACCKSEKCKTDTSSARACCSAEREASPKKPTSALRWISGMAALHCQGQSTLWLTLGAVLPPPP